jgi:hypothetical protein
LCDANTHTRIPTACRRGRRLGSTICADVAAFRALLEQLGSGSDRRLSFVNPAGVRWTLPLYELACY